MMRWSRREDRKLAFLDGANRRPFFVICFWVLTCPEKLASLRLAARRPPRWIVDGGAKEGALVLMLLEAN